MSVYKTFAIVGGTGELGAHILDAFLSSGVSPLVLTRKSSTAAFSTALTVAEIDYENAEEIARVLKEHNIEVVVSAITTFAIASQYALAEAAKKAGVKLFVPSEFGLVTEGISQLPGADDSPLSQKDKFVEHLKSIGLPYARFFTGVFSSFLPLLTGHAQNGKINIVGKGEMTFSMTDLGDIGGYVAYVLTHLPPSDLANRSFRIEGDSVTFIGIAEHFGKEVVYLESFPGGGLGDFLNYLVGQIESGRGSVSWDYSIKSRRRGDATNDKHLWVGHKWKTLSDFSL